MKKLFIILLSIFSFCLLSCSPEQNSKTETITIQAAPLNNRLYYSGVVRPLKTTVITSPAEGVITDMSFQYGDTVEIGKLLFELSSSQFVTNYKTALTAYVKAKNDYNNARGQLTEGEFLYKNELISRDLYNQKKSDFFAMRLALVQAKDALEVFLQQLSVKDESLYKLSIADIDKITQAMRMQMGSQSLLIYAKNPGVVLSSDKAEDQTKRILKGDSVKQGDLLATIGDLSGITVAIKVSELVINELSVGQKVTVTGLAFPDDVLSGQISEIDKQAEVSQNGLPTFLVNVTVPQISAAQRTRIHVGMTAKVAIELNYGEKITIPLTAIKATGNQVWVKKFDESLKQFKAYAVNVGKTTENGIVVLSGLKTGDRIASTY